MKKNIRIYLLRIKIFGFLFPCFFLFLNISFNFPFCTLTVPYPRYHLSVPEQIGYNKDTLSVTLRPLSYYFINGIYSSMRVVIHSFCNLIPTSQITEINESETGEPFCVWVSGPYIYLGFTIVVFRVFLKCYFPSLICLIYLIIEPNLRN